MDQPLTGCAINAFEPLLTRIDPDKVEAIVEQSKETLQAFGGRRTIAGAAHRSSHSLDEITIDDFLKVDLRIARIVRRSQVPEADKL